jgi:hypothetical protein
MNIKRLTQSLLLVFLTDFAGLAMANGGGPRGGAYPTDSLAVDNAGSMMRSGASAGMNMDGCPMMSNGDCPMMGKQRANGKT